jgi:L-seryl-tRNA(Ser) seleniumtransferase
VVNNAAGALVLALNALAAGGRVLISRGELIEIGGAFRIPEIMEKSGCVLVEVGTTNRTHLADYERALSGAAAILTVHRSNFEQSGFVATPAPAELAGIAAGAGIPYLYDIGSGLLADLSQWGLSTEPRVGEAVDTGADLVLFSGDKLLGGPQAGCIVGRAAAIARCRSNPFARALRADKFTLAALEATLSLYRDADDAGRARCRSVRRAGPRPPPPPRRAGRHHPGGGRPRPARSAHPPRPAVRRGRWGPGGGARRMNLQIPEGPPVALAPLLWKAAGR